jgi:uncharacterized protein (TIRG00374 family)
MMAAALGLALGNYALRFCKWELYLRRLGIRVPFGDSLQIFLSGFSLTMTPGKVGEVLKAYLLRETRGVPMARTAPTVVAERLTDLIALLALAIGGIGALSGGGRLFMWFAGGLVAAILIVASWRSLVHWILERIGKMGGPMGRAVPKLREFYDSMFELLRPVPLVAATVLSVGAWACECAAFWIVLHGFPGADASLKLCTFIYASMTIAGALSFLPGGILVQEAGMIELLLRTAHGVSKPAATAATFVVRVCTLWFAIAIGVGAVLLVRRRMRVKLDALPVAGEPAPEAARE